MLKFLTRALDKGAIRMASSFQAGGQREPHHRLEAEKLLNDPDLFSDNDTIAPDLHFKNATEFQFKSAVATRWAENNQVSGRLFRAGTEWKSRPSVILLPYHGRRRPREPGAIQNFISHDLLHMLEATRQSLSDARALRAWLQAEGSPKVGLWGISLGAWLAGLLVCSPKQSKREAASFAVLLTPIAKVDQAIQELSFCKSIRGSLENTATVRLEPLNLASHLPCLPRENILIVESQYDLFAPAETVESLWRAWQQPEIWRLPHGHISILLSPLILQRIVDWIQRKVL